MTQFGVIRFHRIGILFALGDGIHSPVIPQVIVGFKGIAVVALGLRRIVHQLLDGFLRSLPHDLKAQVTAGEPVYDREDEDFFFFSPMKVNNSSSSTSLTWLGTGRSGSWAAWACTHKETVR